MVDADDAEKAAKREHRWAVFGKFALVVAAIAGIATILSFLAQFRTKPGLEATAVITHYELPKFLSEKAQILSEESWKFKVPTELIKKAEMAYQAKPDTFSDLRSDELKREIEDYVRKRLTPLTAELNFYHGGSELVITLKNAGESQLQNVALQMDEGSPFVELVDQDGQLSLPDTKLPIHVGVIDPTRSAVVRAWSSREFYLSSLSEIIVSHANGSTKLQIGPGESAKIGDALWVLTQDFWAIVMLVALGLLSLVGLMKMLSDIRKRARPSGS